MPLEASDGIPHIYDVLQLIVPFFDLTVWTVTTVTVTYQ